MISNRARKVFQLVSLTTAALALTFVIPSARAGDQDFTLVNKTGFEIHNVYISPSNSDDWGDDVMGKDTLPTGGSVEITFSRKESAANWDLKIENEDGKAITWEKLNLKKLSKVVLYYKNGKAWVETE